MYSDKQKGEKVASSYGIDLRRKAMEAIERGVGIVKVAELFHINRKTLYKWRQLKKKTGSLEPRKMAAEKRKRKIKDMEAFRAFVVANQGLTSKEMAEKWHEPITPMTIRRLLHKLGFTVKKNVWIL